MNTLVSGAATRPLYRPLDPKRAIDRQFAGRTREAVVEWIRESGCTYALTLNPNRCLPLHTELRTLRASFSDADRELLGKRFNRKDAGRRLLAFIFAEHPERNLHFHLALRPGAEAPLEEHERRARLLARCWAARAPSGTTTIERVTNIDGWARYITKEAYRPDFEFWLSSFWWSANQRRHELHRGGAN